MFHPLQCAFSGCFCFHIDLRSPARCFSWLWGWFRLLLILRRSKICFFSSLHRSFRLLSPSALISSTASTGESVTTSGPVGKGEPFLLPRALLSHVAPLDWSPCQSPSSRIDMFLFRDLPVLLSASLELLLCPSLAHATSPN